TDTQDPTVIHVDSFEKCVAAGNPVMESLPRQCAHQDMVFVESVDLPDLSDPVSPDPAGEEEFCTREFAPVCGEVEIQCITLPCEPLKTTFGNRCEAEKVDARNITEGACEDEEINPEGACLSFDGTWLEETQECEGMDQTQCEALEGTYNDCALA